MPYSVSELTFYLKHLIEEDPALQGVQVAGEVSNLTYHGSGHVYFTLKDAEAQLSCVMFRANALAAPKLQAGDRITATGDMSLYAPRGNYQLMVRQVQKQGLGDLSQQFLALKERLLKEGLFDPARKRPVPRFPRRIAIITSPTGAAIRDILQTLRRRYPAVEAVLLPAVVQGAEGAASIVRCLAEAPRTGADTVILARGGGSLEDLWNFNEEAVARAIRACPLPVITGIGHETDTTIADFAADLRASTPTAAAEHAVPEREALLAALAEAERQCRRSLQYFIDFKRQVLDDYSNRLQQAAMQDFRRRRHELDLLEARLRAMDLTVLLRQGFTLTLKDGEIQRSAEGIRPGDAIETVFADGRRRSTVEPD